MKPMEVFNSDRQEIGKQAELWWIPISELTTHPSNPRIGRPDKLDSIIESMRTEGYRTEKPMLVRPHNEKYQIIGGHSRYLAAQAVGLDLVLCVLEDMTDDEAILRIGQDNINDPLSWYSVCIYVVQNSVKASKKGLSRVQLIQAATGKNGEAAKQEAKEKGMAGEVLICLIEQSVLEHTLLDPSASKVKHLAAIHSLPESTWPIAVSAMLKGEWSAAETSANVKRAKEFEGASYRNAYPLDLVIRRHFEYPDFSPSTFRKLIAQCRRTEDLIEVSAPDEDREGYLNRFIEWVTESPRWSLADLSAYERTLDAGFKKSVLAAGGFKLGNWRDHAAEVADGSIALLLTDPPYGMNYQSNRRAEKHERITNDGADEAANELGECLDVIFPKLADQAHLLVFVDWRNEPLLREVITNAGYKIRGSLIWKKNVHGSGDLRGSFAPMHERIIHAVKGDPAMVERIPDVLDSAKVQTSNHPTEKPVDLLERLIDATTVEGELVADPFAGVASTLVAAKRKSRAFWGCEISETYHKMGVARL